MIAFVIRRLLQGVIVMLVVGLIAFSLFNFVGDPVALMLPPEATQAEPAWRRACAAIVERIEDLGDSGEGVTGSLPLYLGGPVQPELGFILSCARDEPFAQGYSPCLSMRRSTTASSASGTPTPTNVCTSPSATVAVTSSPRCSA